MMREYGSEFDYIENDNVIQELWKSYNSFHLLRCGRDAVFAVAKTLLKERGIKTIWVPALSCYSMYDGFAFAGYEIKFYPIDSDFNPVLDEIAQYNDSAVLFMLYYGYTENSLIECFIQNHKECVTIIDITHSLWDAETYKLNADILIGSIRKSVGVVNGGIFLSDKFLISVKNLQNQFTELRKKAFKIKNDYNETLSIEKKQEYRKLLSQAEASLEIERGVYCADADSVATILSVNVADLRRKRSSNFNLLYRLLSSTDKISPLIKILNGDKSQFSLPVLVNDQLKIQAKLASFGVYAPVLWPISDKAKQICPFSKKVAENMLSLPIDQRYSIEDMYEIADRVKQAVL